MSTTRTAILAQRDRTQVAIDETVERVARYLPSNYEVAQVDDDIVITGTDVAGWTLDGYVIPRLASGLLFATETTDQLAADA